MDLRSVLARRFEPVVQRYDERDSALYALALGMGSDPLDEDELPYVYEGRGLRAVPGFGMTLAWPRFWHADADTGIDWVRIVHGEQHLALHRPLPARGCVRAEHRIAAVEDKGPGRGALLHFVAELRDDASGAPLATVRQVQFLRGDGGCGAWGEAPPPCAPIDADAAAPWRAIDYPTAPQAALLYRQASRDLMPLHADPQVARAAGFERPISHGLNNLGLACRAILKHHAPGRPERLRALSARFASPGYPGDTVRVELLDEGGGVLRFRARALERGVLLIDRGECRLDPA